MFASAGILSAQADGVMINRRPMTDFAAHVDHQVDSKSVDLWAPFEVELEGTLGKDGRIETGTAKFTKAEGAEASVELIKRGIEAVNDAGWLQYLSQLSVQRVTIRARQNDSELEVLILGSVESESRARSMASALNMILKLGAENKASEEERLLLENSTVSSDSKRLVIKLALPKATVRGIVDKYLSASKRVPQS